MLGSKVAAVAACAALMTACGEADERLKATEALLANERAELAAYGEARAGATAAKYRALMAALAATPADELERSPLIYHPLELQAVIAVARDYGDLYVEETQPGAARVAQATDGMPWAGHWYPRREGGMHVGAAAPLAKLERVARARGLSGGIVAWEAERFSSSHADLWEGMCGSWAMASITSKEPTRDKVFDGETFTVADQKALLTKAREAFPNKIYGVRYDGDAASDGTFQDIRPEAFHTMVVKRLGERGLPFIIDEDAGIEVWSKPVYRVRWTATLDDEIPDALRVRASVWLVKERNAETVDPTTSADRWALSYDYRLYFDPAASSAGRHRIIAGEWTGASRQAHPDMVIVAEPDAAWASANPAFNEAMALVRAIATE